MFRRSLLVLVSLLAIAGANAKALHWRAIDVSAQLDANGLLHIAETQTYVFDGDWNGGERRFDIRAGQSLQLEGVDRVDGTSIVELKRGNLAAVDHYELLDNSTLRWRSRLPSDPPFDQKELTYRIRYTLTGVLSGNDNRYHLAHDFAFPDRPGVIERFTLRFVVDPAWSGIESPLAIEQRDLQPGTSVVVRRELTYRGAATPAGAIAQMPPIIGYAFAIALALGLVVLFLRFLQLERAAGRFGSIVASDEIDEAWLNETVFSLPPEVVGAAWDETVGAPEVAAILATLVRENKIDTSVVRRTLRKPELTMRLLAERDSIIGYQRKLIDKLFFGDRTTTDTDAIRNHYKSGGLDLATLIRGPVEKQLQKFKWTVKQKVVSWKFDVLAVVAALALLIATAWQGGNDAALVAGETFFGAIALLLAATAARRNSRAITHLPWRFGLVIALTLPLLVPTFRLLFGASDFLFHIPVLVAALAWTLAIFNLILDALRTDEAPEKVAMRKKLVAARAYFAKQLRTHAPRLRDDWVPYLIALGLGPNVDSWFRQYTQPTAGTMSRGERTSQTSTSSSEGSRDSGSSWTGGGGSFGGAGATGSWALAAAAVGAGIAAPGGSTGGGSSSSSSSSSSGGGGGGGW